MQIIDVEPYPTSGTKISLSNYTSIFTLSQAGMMSPLKQFKSGINAQQVQCKTGLELVIKAENNSPACVSHSSASALMARGWAIASTTQTNAS